MIASAQMPSSHEHGKQYRLRIQDADGSLEYIGWFLSEEKLYEAARSVVRDPRKVYFGEAAEVRCPECAHLEITPFVISAL
jgi:hypothetical protein